MNAHSDIPSINELYKDVLLDHYNDPRHAQPLTTPTVTAEGQNPICGDELHLTLKVDAKGQIQAIGAETQGCCISVASGSMMAEELEGKSVTDAQEMIKKFKAMISGGPVVESESGDFEALSGVRKFPVRIKCALLPWMTLAQAIRQYHGEQITVVSTEEKIEEK